MISVIDLQWQHRAGLNVGIYAEGNDASAFGQRCYFAQSIAETALVCCRNEEDVGKGVKRFLQDTGTSRGDLFVVTKLWNDDHGYEKCKLGLKESLQKYGRNAKQPFCQVHST